MRKREQLKYLSIEKIKSELNKNILYYKMKKEDFNLGDMIIKKGKPIGIYCKELEGENLGVYFPEVKGIWKINLETQKIEEQIILR